MLAGGSSVSSFLSMSQSSSDQGPNSFSSSSNSSFGGGGGGDSQYEWRSRVMFSQAALVDAAEAPFRRPGPRFARGPRRLSFARIHEEFGQTISCFDRYRFSLPHLRRLIVGLRFPRVVRVRGYDRKNRLAKVQVLATGEEALLVMLRRLSYPCKWSVLAWECGRSPTQLSLLFHWAIDHVYTKFEHLRDARSLECWGPMFPHFARVVHRGGVLQGRRPQGRRLYRGAPMRNCALFVDGSNQYVDRPGIFQHVLYNGHKRAHCVKWQGLMLPNGIMPMPFGPINGVPARRTTTPCSPMQYSPRLP